MIIGSTGRQINGKLTECFLSLRRNNGQIRTVEWNVPMGVFIAFAGIHFSWYHTYQQALLNLRNANAKAQYVGGQNMTQQHAHRLMFVILLSFHLPICLATETSTPSDPNRYLKYSRDTYGPKHTPLFVDGLNIHTHEPVKWIAPNGDRWILSNLASQQNLFRTLDGLTRITANPKYKQAAMDAITYSFENLRSPNGLLYWGGHAAYDLGADHIGSEHCARLLSKMANDYHPWVRGRVAQALGRTGSNRVAEPLLTMLKDENDDVRKYVAAALGDICAEEAIEPLLTTLREDPVGKVQVEAALAIGQIGSEGALEPMLQFAIDLGRPSWPIAEALGSLGSTVGTEQAAQTLLEALEAAKQSSQSPYLDRLILAPIIRGLGKIGSSHSTLPLLEILRDHKDKKVRGTAAIALGRIGAKEAVNALVKSIHEYDAVLSEDALWALARVCPEREVIEFLEAMQHWPTTTYPDYWLELVGVDRAEQLLKREMVSGLPNSAAVRALGDIRSERALDTLLQMLEDESYSSVRGEVIEALAVIGGERAVGSLIRALRDDNIPICWEAVKALGEIGSEQAVGSLLHVLDTRKKDNVLCEYAIRALGEISSMRAMQSIIRALRDENDGVRESAVEALGKLGCGDSIGPLISGLDDDVLYE
jgi:HEAT repeat protein